MPFDNFFYCATCHNLIPSLIIIINDGHQYFKKKSKNLHSAMCKILMDGWKLVMLVWCYGDSCSGIAQ
jgi:hypothetical protein